MRWIVAGLSIASTAILLMTSNALARPAAGVSAQRCTVVVFFTVPATSDQIGAVKSRLRRDAQVRDFRFISRAQALDQMRKKFPELVDNLPSNPLPARIHLQLKVGVKQERFVSRYRALKPRGVKNVTRIEPGPSSCFML